jgi:hypothetical protein
LLKRGVSQVSSLTSYVEEKGNGVLILRAETLEAAHKLFEGHVTLKKNPQDRKKTARCRLHSSSSQEKVCWKDAWAHVSQEATQSLCDIPLDTLNEILDKHLERMRYCPGCQENVEDAFDILTGAMEAPEEELTEEDEKWLPSGSEGSEAYSVDIFAPYQVVVNEQSQLLRCDPSQLPDLVARYREESQLTEADRDGVRVRHAKSLRQGQYEILLMLGEYFERSVQQVHHKRLVLEHEEGMLLRLALQALHIKLEESQQAANTITWDEEELDSNTMTKKKKNKKKKKKKGKNNQDDEDDSLMAAATAADAEAGRRKAESKMPSPGSPKGKAGASKAASTAGATKAAAPPSVPMSLLEQMNAGASGASGAGGAPMSLLDVAASWDEDEEQNLLTSMGWFGDEMGADGEGLSLDDDEMAEELQNLLAERTRLRSRLRNNFKALLHTPEEGPPAVVPGTCPQTGAEEIHKSTRESRKGGGKARAPGRAPAKMQVNLDMSALQSMTGLKINDIKSSAPPVKQSQSSM